jgi:hypothetical protein
VKNCVCEGGEEGRRAGCVGLNTRGFTGGAARRVGERGMDLLKGEALLVMVHQGGFGSEEGRKASAVHCKKVSLHLIHTTYVCAAGTWMP